MTFTETATAKAIMALALGDEKRCPCGGIILADTEDYETPLCYECFIKEQTND